MCLKGAQCQKNYGILDKFYFNFFGISNNIPKRLYKVYVEQNSKCVVNISVFTTYIITIIT